jgi:MscS family membrane protein
MSTREVDASICRCSSRSAKCRRPRAADLREPVMARVVLPVCLLALVLSSAAVRAQTAPGASASTAQVDAQKDALSRETPRGTVRGFLTGARSGNDALAARFLNVRLADDEAATLAHRLFVVLDTRLSARLKQLSTDPEGSRADPLKPDLEVIGTVSSSAGNVNITLERIKRGQSDPIWLFSRQTLDAVPGIYDEISLVSLDTRLPSFLTRIRVAGGRLFDWLTVLLGLPLLYLLTVLLNRLLSPLITAVWRRVRRRQVHAPTDILPTPVRLLFLAIAIRWLAASSVQLPLLARQLWFTAAMVINVAAIAWLLILLNAEVERRLRGRVRGLNVAAAVSLIRVARRTLVCLCSLPARSSYCATLA